MNAEFGAGEVHRGVLGERAALLVVDMARSIADPACESHFPVGAEAALACAELLAACRAARLPVLYTLGGKQWHTSAANALTGPERGRWVDRGGIREEPIEVARLAMEVVPALAPEPEDTLVTKSRPSAFFGTPLAAFLLGLRVDSLIVTGMMTSGCIRATVTDAFSHNLRVVLPQECVADWDERAHHANMRDMGAKYADVLPLRSVLAAVAESDLTAKH